jgi:hypothetical protein
MANKKKKLNFEKRFNDRSLNIDNGDGTHSSHKMMSFEADGKYFAIPTIVQQGDSLVELSENEAIKYAFKNKEFKEFTTDEEARTYASGDYKKGTNLDPIEKNRPNYSDKSKVMSLSKTELKKVNWLSKDEVKEEINNFIEIIGYGIIAG